MHLYIVIQMHLQQLRFLPTQHSGQPVLLQDRPALAKAFLTRNESLSKRRSATLRFFVNRIRKLSAIVLKQHVESLAKRGILTRSILGFLHSRTFRCVLPNSSVRVQEKLHFSPDALV